MAAPRRRSRLSARRPVDFSDPYYLADQSLMVKEGSDIPTIDDVAGKTVGAQKGTTGADFADGRDGCVVGSQAYRRDR